MIRASIAAVACAVLMTQPPQAPRVFRSAAEAVRVDALVTDGHKPIGGLTPADFDLRDSGVAQAIDVAQIVMPFSMLMVLDISSSMTGLTAQGTAGRRSRGGGRARGRRSRVGHDVHGADLARLAVGERSRARAQHDRSAPGRRHDEPFRRRPRSAPAARSGSRTKEPRDPVHRRRGHRELAARRGGA